MSSSETASARGPQAVLGADAELLRRFDAERARALRGRIRWYCIVMLGLLGLSLIGTLRDSTDPATAQARAAGLWVVDLFYDLPLVGLYGAALAYVLAVRPDRRRLVFAVSALTVLASGYCMAMEPIGDWLSEAAEGRARAPAVDAWRPGIVSILTFFALQAIVSVLVPMSLPESLRIVVPAMGLFALVLVTLHRPPLGPGLGLLAAFPLAAAPGVLWSRWRYGEFDLHFRARELRGRYDELSSELVHARRIHEALFPPPITDGAVRMDYRYEPMREIGGDLLFAQRDERPGAPVRLVVLDVSGHGVGSALAVNRLHGEMRRLLHANPDAGPGEWLADLNRYALHDLAPQGVFATVLCLRVDPAGAEVEWASAGHPPAIVRRPDGSTGWLGATATLLGVLGADEFDPAPRTLPFPPASSLLAYTDGAIEACDAAGREFTMEGVRGAVIAAGSAGPGRLAGAIMDAVARHRAGATKDDVLIVEAWSAGADGAAGHAPEAGAGTGEPRQAGGT